MPALRSQGSAVRSLYNVLQVAWDELRRIATDEGPEGQMLFEMCDLTADRKDTRVRLALEFNKKEVWVKVISLSESDLRELSDETFRMRITETMRSTLSLVGQMHHARLESLFPKKIKEVTVEYDPEKARKIIHVHFKNGHVATADEFEAKSDLFTARCLMLHDLPPL